MPSEFRSGSIYIRQSAELMKMGERVPGHPHKHDHTTFATSGVIKIEKFGQVHNLEGEPQFEESGDPKLVKLREITLTAGPHNWALIEASCWHSITCMSETASYACVYSHRIPDGDVTPEYTGWHDAYV